jgi:hypothetical protein
MGRSSSPAHHAVQFRSRRAQSSSVKSISIGAAMGFLSRENDAEAILSRTLRYSPDFVIVATDGSSLRPTGILGIGFRSITGECEVFERSKC